MSERLTLQERQWIDKYGDLPNDQESLISIIQKSHRIDMDRYQKEKERILSMQWKELSFSLPIVPKSTPRARYSSLNNTFYVKGAAENKKMIKRIIQVSSIISTMTRFRVDCYFPTPTSVMKGYEILLAEEGLIRPMITKDWDNLGKTYSDMIQEYLLINDNIICDGSSNKYFSIRPHVDIFIQYQEDYDSDYNRKRVENSKSYKKLMNDEK